MSWWRLSAFDEADTLNQRIWEESPGRQTAIFPPRSPEIGMVAAAQALVGPPALPWVPDLVGRRWKEPGAVILIGSSYADFFSPLAGRTNSMGVDNYRKAQGPADFQAIFLQRVVHNDHAYYNKLAELLQAAAIEPEEIVVTDLCRASFVRVKKNEKITLGAAANENVLRTNRTLFQAYLRANSDWHNTRLDEGSFAVIVALGDLAYEQVKLLIEQRAKNGASFKRPYVLRAPHPGNRRRRPVDVAECLQQLRRSNRVSASPKTSTAAHPRTDLSASTRGKTIPLLADNAGKQPVAVTIDGVGRTFQRLTFVKALIDPLSPDQVFNVITSDGTYSFTKAEFLETFPNVVASRSYREGGLYHFRPPTTPKARPFLLAQTSR
jgi:hypothetical protein